MEALSDERRRVCDLSLPQEIRARTSSRRNSLQKQRMRRGCSIRNRNENSPCSSEQKQNPPYTRGDRNPGSGLIAAKGQGVIFIRRTRTERAASPVLPGRMVNCSFIGNLACSASSVPLWGAAIILVVSAVWAHTHDRQEHGVEHSWSYA